MNKNATNSAKMKLDNRRLLLELLRKKPLSRAELARRTGLTRAAVTLIAEELIKEGLLLESGTMEADFGRKPVLLDIRGESRISGGINLSRNGYAVGLTDLKGKLISKAKLPLTGEKDWRNELVRITGALEDLLKEADLEADNLIGLGISSPGPVDLNAGIILNPPNFNVWHQAGIVEALKRLKLPVYLENNASALALAEKNYGSGEGFESFIELVVDTGIGAGIILKEALYRGVGGYGSEVGHTSVNMFGQRCSCGNRGCLELYASIPAILDYFSRQGGKEASWQGLVDQAMEGNPLGIDTIGTESAFLAQGIVNTMNILELEAVIVAGNITYRPELLLSGIRERVEEASITRSNRKPQILASSLGADGDIVSAAAVVIERFFRGDIPQKAF